VAAFDFDDMIEPTRLDFTLLQNGPITLYFRRHVQERDVAWLAAHGYDVKTFDCSGWTTSEAMNDALASTLGFPSHYGRNSAALRDCLSDLQIPGESGLVLVFRRYDVYAKHAAHDAAGVLDVIGESSRWFLLFGRRLLALVQSDDPRIAFEPVGASPVSWNGWEADPATRGL